MRTVLGKLVSKLVYIHKVPLGISPNYHDYFYQGYRQEILYPWVAVGGNLCESSGKLSI